MASWRFLHLQDQRVQALPPNSQIKTALVFPFFISICFIHSACLKSFPCLKFFGGKEKRILDQMIPGVRIPYRSTVHLEWLLLPPRWQGLPQALENTNRRRRGKEGGGARTQQLVDALDFPLYTPGREGSQQSSLPARLPSLSRPAGTGPAHARSGDTHLHPVSLVQDVLQQPVDHIQRLILLQHNVIGLHVALPLLLHLVI